MYTSESLLDRNEFVRQILHPTTAGKRLANFLLDTFFSTLFTYLMIGAITLLFVAIGTEIDELLTHLEWALVLMSLLIRIGYYVLLEHFTGKTLGKMITQTRVVTEDGEKPTLLQIIGRNFARIIPFEPFSFIAETPIGWHDSLSGTIVINDNEFYRLEKKENQTLYGDNE